MIRTILVVIVAALAGCASFDPRNPKVFVVTNDAADCKDRRPAIVVDQEPIYFFLRPGGQPFRIIWHLQTKGYSFAQRLTALADPKPVDAKSKPGEISKCQANGQNMECINQNASAGYWKYTLKVESDDKGCPSPEDLDPIIGNS
jgi:hypothetical protein